ncbi:hypothetical protein ACX80Z_02865 [Arthrobacter sp. TMT4-20]
MVRAVFYAERLALIEVAIPLALLAVLLRSNTPKMRLMANSVPIIAPVVVWIVFAASEYSRSWIYYSQISTLPFHEWVTYRLLGYYVTGYNNSAIFNTVADGSEMTPYYSVQFFWNAPGIAQVIEHPGISGIPIGRWWFENLSFYGEADFTNYGSFLMTNAELGTVGMVAFWLVLGAIFGYLHRAAVRSSFPASVAYAVLFLGLLELPRLIYWTEGRAFPILVCSILFFVLFPKTPAVSTAGSLARMKHRKIVR